MILIKHKMTNTYIKKYENRYFIFTTIRSIVITKKKQVKNSRENE